MIHAQGKNRARPSRLAIITHVMLSGMSAIALVPDALSSLEGP